MLHVYLLKVPKQLILYSIPYFHTESINFTPSLDRTRPDQLSDEAQRRYAEEVQAMQAGEVAKQLEDFRWEFLIINFDPTSHYFCLFVWALTECLIESVIKNGLEVFGVGFL